MPIDSVNNHNSNKIVIDLLDDLLSDAKKGTIVSIGVAYVSNDDSVGTASAGGHPSLLGGIVILQNHLCNCIMSKK